MKKTCLAMLIWMATTPLFATVDESTNLQEVLENGTLSKNDCDLYHAGAHDEETTLRCGKWMYFYDSMARPGLPAPIVDLLRKDAPQTFGKSIEKLGLYPDPFSKDALPIGFVAAPPLPGKVPTYAMTCATCHFAQLPDGRYKVGQPNGHFDYAALNLAVTVLPQLAMQPKKVLPENAKNKLTPISDEFFGANWSRLSVILQTLRLIPSAIALGQKPMTDDAIETLASLPTGVLDPMAPPAIDDGANIPLRILPLWGLQTPETMIAHGSQFGAMLTSSGGTPDLDHILHTGARIVDALVKTKLSDSFDPNYYEPLNRYILSLKAPKNLQAVDSVKFDQGSRIFNGQCASCHNGPGYAGTKIFSMDEIGTDPLLANIYGKQGMPSFEVIEPSEVTGGVRAPRLEGWWSLSRLLHNGSVDNFASLLCLNASRPLVSTPGYSNQGHTYGCDELSIDDKQALIHFLESI